MRRVPSPSCVSRLERLRATKPGTLRRSGIWILLYHSLYSFWPACRITQYRRMCTWASVFHSVGETFDAARRSRVCRSDYAPVTAAARDSGPEVLDGCPSYDRDLCVPIRCSLSRSALFFKRVNESSRTPPYAVHLSAGGQLGPHFAVRIEIGVSTPARATGVGCEFPGDNR